MSVLLLIIRLKTGTEIKPSVFVSMSLKNQSLSSSYAQLVFVVHHSTASLQYPRTHKINVIIRPTDRHAVCRNCVRQPQPLKPWHSRRYSYSSKLISRDYGRSYYTLVCLPSRPFVTPSPYIPTSNRPTMQARNLVLTVQQSSHVCSSIGNKIHFVSTSLSRQRQSLDLSMYICIPSTYI